jgi:hypothetical protein
MYPDDDCGSTKTGPSTTQIYTQDTLPRMRRMHPTAWPSTDAMLALQDRFTCIRRLATDEIRISTLRGQRRQQAVGSGNGR